MRSIELSLPFSSTLTSLGLRMACRPLIGPKEEDIRRIANGRMPWMGETGGLDDVEALEWVVHSSLLGTASKVDSFKISLTPGAYDSRNACQRVCPSATEPNRVRYLAGGGGSGKREAGKSGMLG